MSDDCLDESVVRLFSTDAVLTGCLELHVGIVIGVNLRLLLPLPSGSNAQVLAVMTSQVRLNEHVRKTCLLDDWMAERLNGQSGVQAGSRLVTN